MYGEKFTAQLLVNPNIAAFESPYIASELPSIPDTEDIFTMTPYVRSEVDTSRTFEKNKYIPLSLYL